MPKSEKSNWPYKHAQDSGCQTEKAGFRIARQGKHIVMTDGVRILTVPRNNPVGGIVRDAGLTVEEFRKLLSQNDSYNPLTASAN